MSIIVELLEKIQLAKTQIDFAQKQLRRHEEKKIKLSYMSEASLELSIEKNQFLVGKYQERLSKIESLNMDELKDLEDKELQKELIKKRNYFKYQAVRIKRDKNQTKKIREYALDILEDLPHDILLEDGDIFTIAAKSKELFLKIHSDLDSELIEIKSEFLELVKDSLDTSNTQLRLLNYRIPIIILQFRILFQNIQENLNDDTLDTRKFEKLPTFEDWWIHELWRNHQAYVGLFQWKEEVFHMCITTEQKKAFEVTFKNWILVKKILDVRGKIAYAYNNAFDELLLKYSSLHEEFDQEQILEKEIEINNLAVRKNFTTMSSEHDIVTPYMNFKLEKLAQSNKDKGNKR